MKVKTQAWMGTCFGGVLLLTGVMVSADATAPNAEIDPQVYTQRMQAHWQSLIQEKDPQKRRVLIEEHRAMMRAGQSALDARRHAGSGMEQPRHGPMMRNHAMQDMNRMMELHSMMLDMMQ